MSVDLSCVLVKLDYLDESVITRAKQELNGDYKVLVDDYSTFISADKLIEIIEDLTNLVSDLQDKLKDKEGE